MSLPTLPIGLCFLVAVQGWRGSPTMPPLWGSVSFSRERAAAVSGIGFLQRVWLTRFSSPAAERPLLRLVLQQRPAKILEIGLGTLERTERLLGVAGSLGPVHYVGLDRFEARLPGDPAGVTLKEAHRRLRGRGRIQLVPGNADSTLARLCNQLGSFDLVLVSASTDRQNLTRCWFFLQRVVRPGTVLMQEVARDAATSWQEVPHERVADLASQTILRRAG